MIRYEGMVDGKGEIYFFVQKRTVWLANGCEFEISMSIESSKFEELSFGIEFFPYHTTLWKYN